MSMSGANTDRRLEIKRGIVAHELDAGVGFKKCLEIIPADEDAALAIAGGTDNEGRSNGRLIFIDECGLGVKRKEVEEPAVVWPPESKRNRDSTNLNIHSYLPREMGRR